MQNDAIAKLRQTMRGNVIGRGDPTVSDRAEHGDARAWMRRVADSLGVRGIKRIAGGLVRGGNAFPDSIYGYGWEWDDLSGSSGAPSFATRRNHVPFSSTFSDATSLS